MNNKSNKTSFSKTNQPKGRGKSERTKILDAMKRMGETEDGFYDLLTTKAFNPEDNYTFKDLLSRMSPLSKSTAPLVEFDFDEKATPYVQAGQIVKAMADGLIPSDIGKDFVGVIQSMLKIQEVTDIDDRLKAIEELANDGE